jgi:L-amino acid N-acyltransferase YncA
MDDTAGSPIVVRVATPDDAEPIREIYAPSILDSATSFETVLPSIDDMAQRVASTLAVFPWLVAVNEGAVVGYAYAAPHQARAAYAWSVNVSVYIAPAWHRRGIGRLLYVELFEGLRAQGFYTAFAGITLPNAASVGLHESLGFTHVGTYHNVGYKAGAWRDVGWWEKPLQAPAGEPSPPAAPQGTALRVR